LADIAPVELWILVGSHVEYALIVLYLVAARKMTRVIAIVSLAEYMLDIMGPTILAVVVGGSILPITGFLLIRDAFYPLIAYLMPRKKPAHTAA
jgi:hypothetical protein